MNCDPCTDLTTTLKLFQQTIMERDAELARLRAEVGRLIAAWPEAVSGDHWDETAGAVWCRDDGLWLVNGMDRLGAFNDKAEAVRAAVAAGLDAGDGSTGPATHGEGEGR